MMLFVIVMEPLGHRSLLGKVHHSRQVLSGFSLPTSGPFSLHSVAIEDALSHLL